MRVIEKQASRITFKVANVERATQPLPVGKHRDNIGVLFKSQDMGLKPIEACSHYNANSVNNVYHHPLFAAVHLAFSEHRPLVLSPDIIWTAILQGVGLHMRLCSEELRAQFVEHAGQKTITVVRTPQTMIEGSPENDWESVVNDLTIAMQQQVSKGTHVLTSPFSTTGPVERAVIQIALLDAFQAYFEYQVMCVCGIPEITLEGTPADWQFLERKVDALEPFHMTWWMPRLRTIARQFARASDGDIDVDFWENIYKLKSAYGGHVINGWIVQLVPYLKNHMTGGFSRQNPQISASDDQLSKMMLEENRFGGPLSVTSEDLPTGVSQVPFKLVQPTGDTTEMEFLGGFLGVEQDSATMSLRPKLGWAVRTPVAQTDLLAKLLSSIYVQTKAPLPMARREMLLQELICNSKSHHFPADFMSFYKVCDGLERLVTVGLGVENKIQCNFRSLADVTASPSRRTAKVHHDMWIRFADCTDGSFIAFAAIPSYDEVEPNWHISRFGPGNKQPEFLAATFTRFVQIWVTNFGVL